MNFTKQVAWTFATRLLMIVNSVAAGIIVAHWLGVEGVGSLAVINVAVATIVQLGSFGLPSSNAYFISQDQAHFRAAAINSLIFALTVGSIAIMWTNAFLQKQGVTKRGSISLSGLFMQYLILPDSGHRCTEKMPAAKHHRLIA